MDTLETMLQKIEENADNAAINLEDFNFQNRNGMAIAKRQAMDIIAKSKEDYEKAIHELTLGIFVFGAKAEEFAKVAADTVLKGEAIVVRANALYNRLGKATEGFLEASRRFSINAMRALMNEMEAIGREIGLAGFDVPTFKESGALATFEDHVRFVKGIIRKTLKEDLNKIYLQKAIFKAAMEAKFTGTILPVIIVGFEDLDEATNLSKVCAKLGGQLSVVDEVTPEFVVKKLNDVKKRIKRS
jgi:hypothetical protein